MSDPSIVAVGYDYAWQHPDPLGLVSEGGASFACRYLSPDPSKNLTLTEATLLGSYGIACVANFESTATRAEDGFAAGAADANLALSQATEAGMPAGRPIYFSVDEDTTVGPNITGYFLGIASVIPLSRIGVYGSYSVVKGCLDAGLVRWAWQTYAWSAGQWDPRAHLRQVQNGMTIGGVSVDQNHAMYPDYGQWLIGADVPLSPADLTAITNIVRQAVSDGAVLVGKKIDNVTGTIMGNDPAAPDADQTHYSIGDIGRAYRALPSLLSAGVATAVQTAVEQALANVSPNVDPTMLDAAIAEAVGKAVPAAVTSALAAVKGQLTFGGSQ